MARALDQIVRDTIGNQAVSIIQLQAQIELLEDQLAALKEENQKAPVQGQGTEPNSPA